MKAILKIKNGKAKLPKDCKFIQSFSFGGTTAIINRYPAQKYISAFGRESITIYYLTSQDLFYTDQKELGFEHTFTLN